MEPSRQRQLLGREPRTIGCAVFLMLSVLAVVLWATGHDTFFQFADSKGFLHMARDPIPGPRAFFSGTHGDTTYHFARVLLPGLAWTLVLGRSAAVGWTLVILNNASIAVIFAVGAEALRRACRPESRVMWLALFPGLWDLFACVYGEVTAIAVLFLVYLFWLDDRRRATRVAAAILPLARETMVLGLLPLVWRDWRRDGWRGAASWLPCLVPMIAWWAVVWARMGAIPPLADTVYRHGVLGLPFSGLASTLRDNGVGLVSVLIVGECVLGIGLAVFVVSRRRWFPFAPAAALFAVLVACLGWRGTWYIGETIRHATVLYVLAIVCVLLGRVTREPRPRPALVQPDRELPRARVPAERVHQGH
ncbi:MAG: hypothetical protein U0V73_11450 [Acidimicrobiia bacterium]